MAAGDDLRLVSVLRICLYLVEIVLGERKKVDFDFFSLLCCLF